MKKLSVIASILLSVFLCLNCDNDTDDSEEYATDQSAIAALIKNTSYLDFSDSYSEDKYEQDTVGGDIDPLAWWRTAQRPFDKDIYIKQRADICTVDVTTYLKGYFNIQTLTEIIQKDLNDTGHRIIVLERTGDISDPYRGWTIKEITGIAMDTQENTLKIDSVRVECGSIDTLITSVSDLFQVENIALFPANTLATITVYGPGENEIVFIHSHKKDTKYQSRRPFQYMGNNTFKGDWYTPEEPERYHVFFDVITHDSMFTDDEAYSSKAWGLPYDIE
ncbi:MAG: hypothetical protein JXA60_11435 [Candidatus Coatesbacteria bacterium]|nr:hypothetical protein [Candidatus Coatesbacteria bacterium]